ncbi:putative short-chain dehydrogenases/reductase [Xylaria longipes]|nr:putative short-chain dehydrogenases/reductase [Xylaria longipes]
MPEKTVLITGCNHGGLGAAMAKAYRAKGFKVFATVRELGKAGTLGDMSGIEILELEKSTGGSLDILVNNAGVSGAMPLLDLDLDKAKRLYDVNVWAQLAMVQAFATMLINAKGTVCNISSVSGELIFAWGGSYNSSRAATTALSETLRLEIAHLGVRVVTVILGAVETSGNSPSNKGDIELPANSHYQKIRDVINQYHKGLVFTKKQNVDVAANNVVNDTLKGGGIFIWRGESSTTSWVTSMINGKSGLAQLGG